MFNKDVYSGRRATLKKMISKGIAFFPANNEAPFNYPDNTYIYRQDSNFSYFFGLNHPDLVGVIDFESGEEILFGVDVTIDDVIWCGPLPSLKKSALPTAATSTTSENTSKKSWPKAVRFTYYPPIVATRRSNAPTG